MDKAYQIQSRWDSEAGVWVAESDDVPGLVAEAESPNALREKLRVVIPEMLELNGVLAKDAEPVQFSVRYQYEDSARACAKAPKEPDPIQERLKTIPGVKLPTQWPPRFERVEPLQVEGELVSERLIRERR